MRMLTQFVFICSQPYVGELHDTSRDEIGTMPIRDLRLSIRARKAIHRCGVQTVAQMATISVDDLREQRCCGPTTIREIIDCLARIGFRLRGDFLYQ